MNYRISKKTFDLTVSIMLLILLMPAFVLICILIFLRSGESPLFIQARGISLSKNKFKIYKFRTMVKWKNDNACQGGSSSILMKPQNKKYIFPFGKFLRRTGMDELPQLLNIIKGEMSFVGPRPLSLDDLLCIKQHYPALYIEREKINLLPGITGYWQLYKDDSGSIENLISLDKYYYRHKSFLQDIKLILWSIPIILSASHKDSILSSKEFHFIVSASEFNFQKIDNVSAAQPIKQFEN